MLRRRRGCRRPDGRLARGWFDRRRRTYTRGVRVRSLGLYTDVSLHGWRGRIVDRGDHLVVTHPDVPAFRGGHLLVFERPPGEGDLGRWCDLFDRSIGVPPAFPYRQFAWDDLDGEEGVIAPFLTAGFEAERERVLTAARLRPSGPAPAGIRLAPLDGDADWRAATEMLAASTDAAARPAYLRLVGGVMTANRRLVDAGRGVWWGAWEGDAIVGTLGLFRVDELARFQSVETHPEHRRRGIAGALLLRAAEEARRAWDTRLLVLVSEDDGPGVGLYARLGLEVAERRVGLGQRRPVAP